MAGFSYIHWSRWGLVFKLKNTTKKKHLMAQNISSVVIQVSKRPEILNLIWKKVIYSHFEAEIVAVAAKLTALAQQLNPASKELITSFHATTWIMQDKLYGAIFMFFKSTSTSVDLGECCKAVWLRRSTNVLSHNENSSDFPAAWARVDIDWIFVFGWNYHIKCEALNHKQIHCR